MKLPAAEQTLQGHRGIDNTYDKQINTYWSGSYNIIKQKQYVLSSHIRNNLFPSQQQDKHRPT